MSNDRIDKVTTRAGDRGRTKLATGKTVFKKSTIVRAIGAVDELNSHTGLAMSTMEDRNCGVEMLEGMRTIQQQLFDIGAVLAMEGAFNAPAFDAIEEAAETLNDSLPPLTEFVLPGGNLASAQLHVCRTVCRRAEAELWDLVASQRTPPDTYKQCARFLNRLSDFFFVLARSVNDNREDQWSGPKRDR